MKTGHESPANHAAHAVCVRGRRALLAGLLLTGIVLAGCELLHPERYEDKYTIRSLTVVFMDEETLQNKWREESRNPSDRYTSIPVRLDPSLTPDKTVQGVFDFMTKTIYCPRMNFEVCGHELLYAIVGRFHTEH